MKIFGQVYVQVLIGMIAGGLLGYYHPDIATQLKPIADGFIKLIKMLLAPIVFGTVAVGIARMSHLKEVGRIGLKAVVYFEVMSTLALAIGLVVANVVQPGAGMNINPASIDPGALKGLPAVPPPASVADFFLGIIPDTFVGAFSEGKMLGVILIAVLTGIALSRVKAAAALVIDGIGQFTQVMFAVVGIVMRLAPLGAGAGVAFTIGKYGLDTLWSLGYLLGALYITTLAFIFLGLGTVATMSGVNFFAFLRYIGSEILVVLGTCSTEAVMPRLMQKLEDMGCAKPVVGLVVPTGYTFNADGTCIYLTLATLFIAQATNTHLSVAQQLIILGVLTLTSKGSAGVAGAGFVTLAATVTMFPVIPAHGLVLLLGIDRFLNEARAVTNLIGNAVATVAVSRWDKALDRDQARRVLSGKNRREQT
ncbi:MAG TPA: C4-dicarboxylate transporter DctA [Asticcacaulis sp.]|nr:C4-dicarboxylate transporter DctA [Asticcacaulis sp.]